MNISELIESVCEDSDDKHRFRDFYSGRGMCGRICIGVVTDSPADFLLEVMHRAVNDDSLSRDDLNHLLEMLGGSKSDSMGLATIVYWPHLEGESND